MRGGVRREQNLWLAGFLAIGLVSGANEARADDVFSNLTPVSPSVLNTTVSHNLVTSNTTSNQGSIDQTKISGQITNGTISNNTISGNHGLTSIMMNTGNNVNFNNSFTVNVIMH